MTTLDISAFSESLSLERFSRYLTWANGVPARAVELYTINCQLSECLYTPLHMLEVSLRNRIHSVLTAATDDGTGVPWYDRPEYQLGSRQAEQLAKAKSDLVDDNKPNEPGRVVAALTFGYWTSFFGKPYENAWQQVLHSIAQRPDGKGLRRKDFAAPLGPLRNLRNRIAHHEPILGWNLPKQHDQILQLTEWLSPAAAVWCRQNSRFAQVYPRDGLELHAL